VDDQKILVFEVVDPADVNLRLDKWLGLKPELGSRSQVLLFIERGWVTQNNKKIDKPSYRVVLGDKFEVHIQNILSELVPKEGPLDIFFEDEHLIVINKPSGLVVHPSLGHWDDSLVHRVLYHSKLLSEGSAPDRPGVVHRLDKQTSGLIVMAKTNLAHQSLAMQFQKRTVHRIYYALVEGLLKSSKGVVKSYLARHPKDRKKYASLLDSYKKIIEIQGLDLPGKWAVTHYQKLWESPKKLTYVKLKLETGRTHQIRIHLSEMGHPILGDALYKAQNNYLKDEVDLERIFLHASELGFIHPVTGQMHNFEVDWPEKDLNWIKKLY